jgi:hypothetical protein
MTVLRTKDPRFTLPLIGPLLVAAGAWVSSWQPGWRTRALKAALIGSLSFQAYAANFGVRWLPPEVILARGYQGSFRWDWNLYLQHYFHTLGEPRREDWKQEEIMRRVADDARRRGAGTNVALIPDLPRFNAVNFQLIARLRSLPVRVDHLRNAPGGLDSFAGCQYVILTVTDQGMPWSTGFSAALNRIVFSHPDAFELLQSYDLPDGNQARLYAVRTGPARLSGRADAI